MTGPSLRPLSTGEILDVAFSLYRRHFVTLALVALISQAVGILFSIYLEAAGGMLANPGLAMVSLMVSSVCAAIGMGASTKVIADSYLGRSSTVGAAIGWVVPSIGRLIVLMVVVSLLVGIGFILLIVPGAILGTGLAVSACALVVEGLGATDAMNRSWSLTKGYRWKVFATMAVALCLIYLISLAAVFVGGFVALALGGDVVTSLVVVAAVSAAFSVLVYPYVYSAVTVLYYDLRVRKEGFDLELRASQLGAS